MPVRLCSGLETVSDRREAHLGPSTKVEEKLSDTSKILSLNSQELQGS